MGIFRYLRWGDVFDLSPARLNEHRNRLLEFNKQKCLVIQNTSQNKGDPSRHAELHLILNDLKRHFSANRLNNHQLLYDASVLWYHHCNTAPYVQSYVQIYYAIASSPGAAPSIPECSLALQRLLEEVRTLTQSKVGTLQLPSSLESFPSALMYKYATNYLSVVDKPIYLALQRLEVLNLWPQELIDSMLLKVCGPLWENVVCYLLALSRTFEVPFGVLLAFGAAVSYAFIHSLFCLLDAELVDLNLDDRIERVRDRFKVKLQTAFTQSLSTETRAHSVHNECAFLIQRSSFYSERLNPTNNFSDALRANLFFALEECGRVKFIRHFI